MTFVIGFHVDSSDGKVSNYKYFKHFFSIKCVGLESIIFAINLDVACFKVSNAFDFSIDCITNLYQLKNNNVRVTLYNN